MDFLNEIWSAWNNQWGATVATILATIALLKGMGKEVKSFVSTVWHWKGWSLLSNCVGRAKAYWKVRRARSVMRRKLIGTQMRIPLKAYEDSLRDDPSQSTQTRLKEITPSKPPWLNDYYVATSLESLSTEGSLVKAEQYSLDSWPPEPIEYYFEAVGADRNACDVATEIQTNGKCLIYQRFSDCSRPLRFEPQHSAETVSVNETIFRSRFPLMDQAPPCELCWEDENRERDIRILVDKITKYDLAEVATPEIAGTNGELQEVVSEACIECQCPAEVEYIKRVIEVAIDTRKRQIASCSSGAQIEWQQDKKEELISTIGDFIKSLKHQ